MTASVHLQDWLIRHIHIGSITDISVPAVDDEINLLDRRETWLWL